MKCKICGLEHFGSCVPSTPDQPIQARRQIDADLVAKKGKPVFQGGTVPQPTDIDIYDNSETK